MYKLWEIESNQYEIHILTYPFHKRCRVKKFTKPRKDENTHHMYKATEQCISILVDVYGINENYITEDRSNIYCPFHENENSSKSPSARFRISKHNYICYSSQCPLKRVPISSIELLYRLKKKLTEYIP